MNIYNEVSTIKGIGPKTAKMLNKCGINSILDLIVYFPREYEESYYCDSIENINESRKIVIKGSVKQIKKDIFLRKNLIISNVVFTNKNINFEAKWYNQPYVKNKFKINSEYILCGKLEVDKYKKCLMNPYIIESDEKFNKITPIYSLSDKLTNNFFIKTISSVLSSIKLVENLPTYIVEKYKLCSLDEAIRNMHMPKDFNLLREAKKRLKFQELFTYSLKLELIREYKNNGGISFKISDELKILKERIPFKLTEAQNRVVREILIDQKKDKPMNRLVQGDVGSGKTIIALIAIFNIIKNGYQAALMAPTEILAYQHYEEAKKLFRDFDINIEMLAGSTTIKNKKRIKDDLKKGKIDILIGTHALLEEDVEFENIGMIVTDEQHRFGVRQRNKLLNKNNKVDVLVMSATPIPRTLVLTLYGDLDISTINELPPGRKKVDTFCVNSKMRKRIYTFALKEIEKGAQVYIVCPLVEENDEIKAISVEKLYNELKENYFKDISLEILHGRMQQKIKDEIMENFKIGNIKAIISTTVIEVGVNVPNATIMIIENAERFGLSQLHQLRGRVGRGSKQSYCILVSDLKNEVSKKRMNILTSSNNGFFIAEEDLKLRGSGEIFGVNQHGENGLILSDIINDFEIFKYANKEAKNLIRSNDEKDIIIKNRIIDKLNQTSKYICFN